MELSSEKINQQKYFFNLIKTGGVINFLSFRLFCKWQTLHKKDKIGA